MGNIWVSIGVAPITQLRKCVIKIVTFKGGHLVKVTFYTIKERIRSLRPVTLTVNNKVIL